MKRIFALLLTLMLGVALLFSLASCGECEHTYGEWVVDREATESEVGERHRECTKCGDKITEEIPKLAHTHTYAEAWSYDNAYHFHASTCGHASEVSGKAAHTYGDWIIDREATEDAVGAKHRVCTVCHKVENAEIPELSHTHSYAETWSYDDTYHFHASTCGHTDEVSEKAAHTYGDWILDREATEDTVGAKHRVCTVCDKVENAEIEKLPHTHKYASAWSYDDTYHWHASTCGHTNEVSGKETHTYVSGICTSCKYESDIPAEGLSYRLSESGDSYIVTGIGSCKRKKIIIPNTYNNLPVTRIGYRAFADFTGLTSVEIPNSVTSIDNYAFFCCAGLTSVVIPDSVTSIGDTAFWGCCKLIEVINHSSLNITVGSEDYGYIGYYAKHITKDAKDRYLTTDKNGYIFYDDESNVYLIGYEGTETELVLPETTSKGKKYEIYIAAFSDYTGLTSIMLPGSVTSIGMSVFWGCTGLTSITIPDSVTSIGEYAFYGCTGLTSITIPNSVTSIGNAAFSGCTGLTSITIPSSVTSIGNAAFSGCTGLTSITIPSSVTSIGGSAFSGCTGLTSITIPNSITSIGGSAFFGCTGLTSITIPNSVTSIGDSAFSYCTGLTSITIPDSVTSIGNQAFRGCKGLTSITTPNSVTSIGDSAFEGCTGLTSIMIPNSVTNIDNRAFKGCTGLTSITIPNSVTNIGDFAFSGCTELTSITIGNNVTRIGIGAFSGCAGPTSITIPNSVTSIENSAFRGCYRLIEVINHSSLNIVARDFSGNYGSLGYYAMHIITDAQDTYLTTDDNGYIFYDDGSNAYLVGYTGPDTELVLPEVSPKGKKYEIYSGAFYGRTELTYITISNSVTYIGYCAFKGCTGLTRITISNSVTSIDDGAFSGCSGLAGIAIPDSVTSIDNDAFFGCTGLMSITVDSKNPVYRASGNCLIHMVTKTLILGCKNSVLPSDGSVTSIRRYAFWNCTGLTSITIPNSVTSIGDYAFVGCTGLMSVTIPNSVTSIGEGAFSGCTGLTSITIPDSVTSIGWYAFSGCTGLTTITISNSVTIISYGAFSGCTGLTTITIPNSVTGIDGHAFSGCTGLTSITIPDSVTYIDHSAFENCRSLKSITIPNSVTYIGRWVFEDCEKVEILFDGTQEEWEKVEKDPDWKGNSTCTVTYLK